MGGVVCGEGEDLTRSEDTETESKMLQLTKKV